MAHPGGRPTDYTPELARHICELIVMHPISIKKLCAKYETLPTDFTVYNWLGKYPEFSRQYLEAKESQAHAYSDSIMDYLWDVDERTESIAKANLILNGAKWHLSKLAPKQFGDKKEIKQEMNISVHEQDLQNLK